MGRELEEILQEFEDTRTSFNTYRSKKEVGKGALLEYQSRFLNLRSELRYMKANLLGEWIKRDDKAATGIKFRIAIAIHEGKYSDEKGDLIYDACTINQAEKFASGSKFHAFGSIHP